MGERDQSAEPKVNQICQERGIYSVETPPPRVDIGRMLKTHGYRAPEKAPAKVVEEASRACRHAEIYARPQSFFRILTIESLTEGKLALLNGPGLTCAAFDQHLAGCSQVCIFITTLGPTLDEKIQDCIQDQDFQPLEALFLGTFGWLMIEAVTRDLMRMLKTRCAGEAQSLTLRMGPGYSYRVPDTSERARWDLTDQAAVFDTFEGIELPVELTAGYSMKPTMTRSGLAGLKHCTLGPGASSATHK